MIKFRCPHCNQKIGLTEQYAGKQVRCAKCKKPLSVPQASTEVDPPDKAVIRFNCSNCPQKLKVSIKHAGGKVKCPKCGEPLIIPQSQDQAMLGASAGGTTIADDLLESHTGTSDFLQELEKAPPTMPQKSSLQFEQAVSVNNSLRCVSCGTLHSSERRKCSLCGGQLTVETGLDKPPATAKQADIETSAEEFAPKLDNMVLGILGSVGFTVLGGIGWCIAAKFIGVGWMSFMAVVICCLAGGGFYLFTQNRSVAVGILAAMIGFMGILNGKTLIAKYVTMPKMKQFMSEGASQFGKMFENHPMEEKFYEDMIKNEDLMFAMAAMQLAEEGQIEEELAEEMLNAKMVREEDAEKNEGIVEAEAKVQQAIDGWSTEKKKEVAEAQYGKVSQKYMSMFMETEAGKAASFVGAWILSLSCQDVVWIPLGLFCAYKVARGED